MAHLGDIDSYDGMVATLLGDLANQALGRNQGFRYQGRQAIVLIDPRWYPAIVGEDVLRYRLNPWSTELPSFNKKTSKKSVREAIQMSDEQSALERRLIELIHDFRKFGLSDEATRLAQKLPDRQQKLFQKWRDEALAEAPALELAQIKRKADVKENVRRFRERQKADRQIGLMARAPIPDPVAPN
jgi:hypothetical protein